MATRRNLTEIQTEIATNIPTNGVGDIDAAKVRSVLEDMVVSSTDSDAIIYSEGGVFPLTTLPQKLDIFDVSNSLNSADILTPDHLNDKIIALQPCEHRANITVGAEWSNNVGVFFEVYVGGAPLPNSLPIELTGRGPGKTVSTFESRDGTVGVNAPYSQTLPTDVELWAYAASPTTVTFSYLGLELQYATHSIRTV